MKKSELKFKSEFVGRCVFDGVKKGSWNYDDEYARRVTRYLRKAQTTDEFIDLYLADEINQNRQAFGVLLSYERPNQVRTFLRIFAVKHKNFKTVSDAGSVKIGNGSFSILIPNGYGDGMTDVCVVDDRNENPFADVLKFLTSVEGKIDIYSADCGNSVETGLIGRYGIYYGYGFVVFEKWSTEKRYHIVRIDSDGSRDFTLAADYNTDNYTVAELEEIARAWTEEDADGTRYEVVER